VSSGTHRRAAICGLLFSRRPFAIGRLVIAIVVYALKRQPFRPEAHIFEEVFESEPSFAHRNPSTAVIRIFGSSRIQAPSFHRTPNTVLRYIFPVLRKAMFCFPFGCEFSIQAAAAFGETTTQVSPHGDFFFPAIALAYPIGVLSAARRESHGYQTPEASSNKTLSEAHVVL
jgi:hypothetical protein